MPSLDQLICEVRKTCANNLAKASSLEKKKSQRSPRLLTTPWQTAEAHSAAKSQEECAAHAHQALLNLAQIRARLMVLDLRGQ